MPNYLDSGMSINADSDYSANLVTVGDQQTIYVGINGVVGDSIGSLGVSDTEIIADYDDDDDEEVIDDDDDDDDSSSSSSKKKNKTTGTTTTTASTGSSGRMKHANAVAASKNASSPLTWDGFNWMVPLILALVGINAIGVAYFRKRNGGGNE